MLTVRMTIAWTTYTQVVNYLVCSYAIKNIAETEDDTAMFTLLPNKNSLQHAKELLANALRHEDVYEYFDFNYNSVKRLDKSI